ncbi:Fc.00g044160.m01.CDS01 [Cosmosporella sp. VM-42]
MLNYGSVATQLQIDDIDTNHTIAGWYDTASLTRSNKGVKMQDKERVSSHPYLSGNFAPIHTSLPLTPCSYEGTIPADLAGGEYIRNGGNPLTNDNLGRDAHWFDGDGMLSGVLFRRKGEKGTEIQPEFVNQYLLTDLYCFARQSRVLRKPILPSVATLVSPLTSWMALVLSIFRTVLLVIISRFPGRQSIERISVANTNVIFHDGRALATCESGPPLRFALPGLETIGWFNGRKAENEATDDRRPGFGGEGVLSFMREWATAHPRVDPVTKELIMFHSTFAKPFVRYSIVQPAKQIESASSSFDIPVPGIDSPKMMHDFGVSRGHTIIMDLPLSLDPMNQLHGAPSLWYDSTKRSRFGIFPRCRPSRIQWFETNPCLIFHTANCWDTMSPPTKSRPAEASVNLLACRLTSASMVFRAGNLPTPEFKPVPPEYIEEEQCRLYYYEFPLSTESGQPVHIRHQWALSAIPFEFPTMSPHHEMRKASYIYGCTTTESFTVALGKAAKIDFLVKMNVRELIQRGVSNPPQAIKGCADLRNIGQVLRSRDKNDPIRLFQLPEGFYAQEPRFVPRSHSESEDDGWLLTYIFDEAQLDASGECPVGARSELWIIDAKSMKEVVAKIKLPQRVPYGLHGNWFSEKDIQTQRPFDRVRSLETAPGGSPILIAVRDMLERWVG